MRVIHFIAPLLAGSLASGTAVIHPERHNRHAPHRLAAQSTLDSASPAVTIDIDSIAIDTLSTILDAPTNVSTDTVTDVVSTTATVTSTLSPSSDAFTILGESTSAPTSSASLLTSPVALAAEPSTDASGTADSSPTGTPVVNLSVSNNSDSAGVTRVRSGSAVPLLSQETQSADPVISAVITKVTEIVPAVTTTITSIPLNGHAEILVSTIRASFTALKTYIVEAHGHNTITKTLTEPYPTPTTITSATTTYSPVVVKTTYTTVITLTKTVPTTFKSFNIYHYTTKKPITEVGVGEITGHYSIHPITATITSTITTTEEVFPIFVTTTIVENGTPVISTLHVHHHSDDYGIHSTSIGDLIHYQAGHNDATQSVSLPTYTNVLSNTRSLTSPNTQGDLLSTQTSPVTLPTPGVSLPTVSLPSSDSVTLPTVPQPTDLPSVMVPSVSAPSVSVATDLPLPGDLVTALQSFSTSRFLTTELITVSEAQTTVIGIPTHIPAVSLFTSVQTVVTTLESIYTLTGLPTTVDLPATSAVKLASIQSVSTPSIPSLSILAVPSVSIPSISVPPISVPSITLPTISVPSISVPSISAVSVSVPSAMGGPASAVMSPPAVKAAPTSVLAHPPVISVPGLGRGQEKDNMATEDFATEAPKDAEMPVEPDAPKEAYEFRIRGRHY